MPWILLTSRFVGDNSNKGVIDPSLRETALASGMPWIVLTSRFVGDNSNKGVIDPSLREAALALRGWCDEAISFSHACYPLVQRLLRSYLATMRGKEDLWHFWTNITCTQ
jgi:hypothetical protein